MKKGGALAWCGTGLPPIKPRAIDTGEAANARLITSAPELVRELKRLASPARHEPGGVGHPMRRPRENSHLDRRSRMMAAK